MEMNSLKPTNRVVVVNEVIVVVIVVAVVVHVSGPVAIAEYLFRIPDTRCKPFCIVCIA